MPDSKDQSRSWILQIFQPRYHFIATSPRPLKGKQYSLNSLIKQTCGCCREETERGEKCKKWTSEKVKKFHRLPQNLSPVNVPFANSDTWWHRAAARWKFPLTQGKSSPFAAGISLGTDIQWISIWYLKSKRTPYRLRVLMRCIRRLCELQGDWGCKDLLVLSCSPNCPKWNVSCRKLGHELSAKFLQLHIIILLN